MNFPHMLILALSGSAASRFTPVAAFGPFSTLQAFGRHFYTANGSLNLATGAFTRSGVNWNQMFFYGTDALFDSWYINENGYCGR